MAQNLHFFISKEVYANRYWKFRQFKINRT